MDAPRLICLEERTPEIVSRSILPSHLAQRLRRSYGQQVQVDSVWDEAERPWRLTPTDTIGHIPLSEGVALHLKPKVPLRSVFSMLEWVYDHPLNLQKEQMTCESLQDYYDSLATILARRVRDRARKGLYRDYVRREDDLPYVRGRMDMRAVVRRPWAVKPHCRYQEHTADLVENQLLLWTLRLIARGSVQRDETRRDVRHTCRLLQSCCSLHPFDAQDCVDRLYNRLNGDYHPLHALCRFFLEHTGPTHRQGDRHMLPFLIEMHGLYEKFVATWLEARLPQRWRLEAQEAVPMGRAGELTLSPDLVIYDRSTKAPACVLDTKYKRHAKAVEGDVYQVVAYAEALHCSQAYLIYPVPLDQPLDAQFAHVRVRSLTFALDAELDLCGQSFLERLALA